MAVTQRIYEANVLFAVAVNSAEDIQAPRAGGQLKALVSLVFSVISIEAFLNEAAGLALPYSKHAGEPQEVAGVRALHLFVTYSFVRCHKFVRIH